MHGYRGIGAAPAHVPSVGPPPRHQQPIQLNANLHVDGEKVASNVSHHMARGMEFPAGMGGDKAGHWSAGALLTRAE